MGTHGKPHSGEQARAAVHLLEQRVGRRLQYAEIAPYFGRTSVGTIGPWLRGKIAPGNFKTMEAIGRLHAALCGAENGCPAGFKDPLVDAPLMLAWHAAEEAKRVAKVRELAVAGTPRSEKAKARLQAVASNGLFKLLDAHAADTARRLDAIEAALNAVLVEWRGTRGESAQA